MPQKCNIALSSRNSTGKIEDHPTIEVQTGVIIPSLNEFLGERERARKTSFGKLEPMPKYINAALQQLPDKAVSLRFGHRPASSQKNL